MKTTSTAISAAAWASLVWSGAALIALVALHGTSPEFDPAWRMVSEYADGSYSWLLSVFFFAWAASSWALAAALWVRGGSWVMRVGTAFVALAGVGEAMGGWFDIHHPLHGAAFGLGVPFLALGALLVGASLARQQKAPWVALVSQAPWLSIVAMAGSFALCMSTAHSAGATLSPDAPWDAVPPGVIAVMGWANRLLVVTYVAWAALVARLLLVGDIRTP